jgi:hypothetical protein
VEVLYTVTNQDGCSASAVDSIFVDVCTGKNEIANSKLWLSFANRIQRLDNHEGFKQYAVYDVAGRLLLQAAIPQAGNINLQNLNSGFYVLYLFNQNLRKTFTVVIAEN